MKCYFLNVGYGEAIVVQAQEFTMVVDGGPAKHASAQTISLARFLRRKGVGRVDLMIITHIHEDHIGGLAEVVRDFEIGEIWCNICPAGDIDAMLARLGARAQQMPGGQMFYRALAAYGSIANYAALRGIPMHAMPGDGKTHQKGSLTLTLFGMESSKMSATQRKFERMIAATEERLLFQLFYENDFICNSTSLAVHVREGACSALLTGDKIDGWDALRQKADFRAEILKITHHGQIDGMAQDMLEGADPSIIVVCADENHTYGSANPTVLARAKRYLAQKERSARIYITGELQQGGTCGNVLQIETGRSACSINALVETYE